MCIRDRPYFVYDAAFAGQSCGGMDTQMAREFFYAVSYSAMMNLHLKVLYGENDHHKLEAMFKAFAKALDLSLIHILFGMAHSRGRACPARGLPTNTRPP